MLELLREKVAHNGLRLLVDGVASASRAFENQLAEAVELSERVLAEPDAHPTAVEWAAIGGALALALMGRSEEVAAVAERAAIRWRAGSTGSCAIWPRSVRFAH